MYHVLSREACLFLCKDVAVSQCVCSCGAGNTSSIFLGSYPAVSPGEQSGVCNARGGARSWESSLVGKTTRGEVRLWKSLMEYDHFGLTRLPLSV